MASNSLKNPGKILEFCGCGKVGTMKAAVAAFLSGIKNAAGASFTGGICVLLQRLSRDKDKNKGTDIIFGKYRRLVFQILEVKLVPWKSPSRKCAQCFIFIFAF